MPLLSSSASASPHDGRFSRSFSNSRKCAWREASTPEEWGILSVGPAASKSPMVKSTLFCSAADRLFHHAPNSSENSTSQSMPYYVTDGIMSSTVYRRALAQVCNQRAGVSRMAQPPPGASFSFKTVFAFTRRFSNTESFGCVAAFGPSE